MDWLRQVPIGQYVAGRSGWLRRLDPRLKFAWVVMFLVTPVLASLIWRVGLVVGLFLITLVSSLPTRIWLRPFVFLVILASFVGGLAMFLPIGDPSATFSVRPEQELQVPNLNSGQAWELLRLGPIHFGFIDFGPLVIDRRSAELGLKTSTLIFTVIHSVNLMLLTSPPEDLVWALSWFMSPLAFFGVPVDRISFQLLLSLRFLPLVQEELQNLIRSVSIRAVSFKKLGLKASFGLVLSVGERLLANILLRAEQGSEALLARGARWLGPDQFRTKILVEAKSRSLNISAFILLLMVCSLRGKYGAL